jgi:hypothetical protein
MQLITHGYTGTHTINVVKGQRRRWEGIGRERANSELRVSRVRVDHHHGVRFLKYDDNDDDDDLELVLTLSICHVECFHQRRLFHVAK